MDYLSENELIRYPFKDNTSLNDGTVYLGNSFLLDAQVVLKGDGLTVFLKSISSDSSVFDMRFDILDSTYALVDSIVLSGIPYADIVARELYGTDSAYAYVRLIPGQSLVDLKGSTFVYTFALSDTELSPSCVVNRVPTVDSVSLYNLENKLTTITDDLDFDEGYNVGISGTSSIRFDVGAGNGDGLYDICGELEGIKSIAGVTTDNRHFILNHTGCYRFDFVTNGIAMDNICTPRCEPDQIQSFAHYLNRVKDGQTDLSSYIDGIATDLSARMDIADAEVPPTVSVVRKQITTSILGTKYISFSYQLNNFTNADKQFQSQMTIGVGTGTLQVDSSKYIDENGDETFLATPDTTRTIPCYSSVYIEFAVRSTPPTTVAFATLAGGGNTFGASSNIFSS